MDTIVLCSAGVCMGNSRSICTTSSALLALIST
jgi:hypothetical protein